MLLILAMNLSFFAICVALFSVTIAFFKWLFALSVRQSSFINHEAILLTSTSVDNLFSDPATS